MPFQQSLRKRFWLVPSLLVMVAAYLNAKAVGELIGLTLAPDAEKLAKNGLGPTGAAARITPSLATSANAAARASARPILERNPFDHVAGSLVPATPSASEASDADTTSSGVLDASDPWNAPSCDGIDVNAIVASGDANWSLASIAGPDKKAVLLRRGGELSGKKVHFIGWDRVWFTAENKLCQTPLFAKKEAPAAAPPPVASGSASPPSRSGKPLDPDLKKGIQAVSATEFNIDRGVVDKILENQAELMRSARVVPVQENGRVTGVRMTGIRPDTLLGTLGMQNGDQLQSINGFEVANPEKALEAYARLRTADKLTIQINRGGKQMNLDYNIK